MLAAGRQAAAGCHGRLSYAGNRCNSTLIIAHARRSRPRPTRRDRKRGSSLSKADSHADIDADELLQVLNSSHEWLHQANDSDFGLDDVAAHAAGRTDVGVFLGTSVDKSNLSFSSGRPLDKSAQDLLPYVDDLRAAGFDIINRQGEVLVQRSAPDANSSPQSSRKQQQQVAALPQRLARTANSNVKGTQLAKQHTEGSAAAGSAGAAAGSGQGNLVSCQVQQEFSTSRWQLLLEPTTTGSISSSTAGPPSSKGGWLEEVGLSDLSASTAAKQGGPTGGSGQQTADPPGAARDTIVQALQGYGTPDQLLQLMERVFPDWAANACHLVSLALTRDRGDSQARVTAGLVAVDAPTPAEAAAALHVLAVAARSTLRAPQMLSLARDRQVLGLVECLRVTPPRLQPDQDSPGISRIMWAAAKAYWLQQEQPGRSAAAAAVSSTASMPDRNDNKGKGAAAAAAEGRQIRATAAADAVWALTVLGGATFYQQEMEALLQLAQWNTWPFTPRQLSNVLWALGQARHWSTKVVAVEAALLRCGGLPSLSPSELCSSLWGCATLNYTPRQLMEGLALAWGIAPGDKQQQQVPVRRSSGPTSLGSGQLASICWALAVLQQVEHPVFKSAWEQLLRRGLAPGMGVRQLLQVWQVHLAVQLEGSYTSASLHWDAGAEKLLEAASSTMKRQTAALSDRMHSSYQRDIAKALSSMGILHATEDNSSGYAVDVSIPSLKAAIEADGPTHTARTGDGTRLLGATAMKRRHLQLLGWHVINVQYKQWNLLTSEQQRQAFLSQQLAEASGGAAGRRTGKPAAALDGQ